MSATFAAAAESIRVTVYRKGADSYAFVYHATIDGTHYVSITKSDEIAGHQHEFSTVENARRFWGRMADRIRSLGYAKDAGTLFLGGFAIFTTPTGNRRRIRLIDFDGYRFTGTYVSDGETYRVTPSVASLTPIVA